ncbi:MAG: chloride channel protein [Rhodomicrobium sp.]
MTIQAQITPQHWQGVQRRLAYYKRRLAAFLRLTLLRSRENELAIIVLAAFVGFLVGIGVGVIGGAVAWLHFILFGAPIDGHLSEAPIPPFIAFLAPVLGGLLIAVISSLIRYLRPREIVDAIEANALYGGRMSLWDSINLALLTVVSVGFGGSAGLEAAYTQVGSGFASKAGQSLLLRRHNLRLIVGCGSAAAISAAFNSPLAGAFYAFELVLGSYTLASLAPVASAAVCGNLAVHEMQGPGPMFVLPAPVTLESHDYIMFLLLGFGAAAISIGTMRAVTIVENTFRHRKVPGWLRPIAGGLAVGSIAMLYTPVLGSGHGEISRLLSTRVAADSLTALLIAKIAASALTVGSGMRGGLFSSSLFLGAVFGGAVAAVLQNVAPQFAVNPVAYALVGMGAVAGGIVGAPITMVLLVLETTGNFSLTIGVMAAVIACTVVVRQTFGYSFATWRFHARGLSITGAHDIGWIADLTVGKLMRRDAYIVPASETIAELRQHFPLGGPKYAFAVDEAGAYIGTIETIEAHSTAYDGKTEQLTAADLIHQEPHVLTPAENIQTAILMFTKTHGDVLPVVDSLKTRHVIGFVTEAYVLRRYGQELEKRRLDEVAGGVFSPETSHL